MSEKTITETPAADETTTQKEQVTPAENTPEGKTGNEQPFKTFATEEEYNKMIKSEQSKAKNELLKEMGVKSVQETKDALAKAALFDELNTKYQKLEENLVLTELGIKDEFRDEALILAKSKVTDEIGLKDALVDVIKKMPNLAKSPVANIKIGTEKGDNKGIEEENSVSKRITEKHPWIKF